ncbi:MAG TPA: hypothetical protein VHY35_07300 [Stellaceae bacterium]|jgi:hypothetical protein|nr:hypothetical protein [Stellaceae bacterium]
MRGQLAFSAAVVLGVVADAAVAKLDQLGNERGLSDVELAQLTTFEALQVELRTLGPWSFAMCSHAQDGDTERVREKVRRLSEASFGGGMPLVDLLDMRGAVPADWCLLPVTIDSLLWLGITRLIEDLALIVSGGMMTSRRQQQLAVLRDMQGAFGRVIRLAQGPADQQQRATDRANASFVRAAHKIDGDDLLTIRDEAAALRAKRR